MIKKNRYIILTFSLFVSLIASAQSFESLKRSLNVPSKLYMAVTKALQGDMPLQEAKTVVAEAESLTDAFDGKTPIYLLMDFIATHPIDSCTIAESLLKSFAERPDFDVNLRYRSLMPPLNHLIRENYHFLGNDFSPHYISANVIRTLVGKGASVNSYNTDGSSLMTFARKTNNAELQNFILEKGIDLSHVAHDGKNEIYNVIESGNPELLKKVLSSGRAKIDVTTIENDINKLIKHRDAYEILAVHCAKSVSNYDELTLFLQKFDGRKELVAGKYQEMAKGEMNSVKSFDEVMTIARRYPDAISLIKENQLKWYKTDCQRLLDCYELALLHARNGSGDTLPDDDISTLFVECYGNKHNFDPDKKLRMAQEICDYRNAVLAMRIDVSRSYWEQDEPLSIIVSLFKESVLGYSHTTKFYREEAIRDVNLMKSCMTTISNGSMIKEFQSYYDRIRTIAGERYSLFYNNLRQRCNEYEAAVAEDIRKENEAIRRRKREMLKEDEERLERKRLKKQEEEREQQRQEAAIEGEEQPAYSIIRDWVKMDADILSYFAYGACSFDEILEILFEEGRKKGLIGYLKDPDLYVAIGSCQWYTSMKDAIIAEYVYHKYGAIRKTGRKGLF